MAAPEVKTKSALFALCIDRRPFVGGPLAPEGLDRILVEPFPAIECKKTRPLQFRPALRRRRRNRASLVWSDDRQRCRRAQLPIARLGRMSTALPGPRVAAS